MPTISTDKAPTVPMSGLDGEGNLKRHPDQSGETRIADGALSDDASDAQMRLTDSIFVYEAPLRLWHWVNAAAIMTLAITGYLIASPLWAPPGEASAHFVMGYTRFIHFSAGYVLTVGFLGRLYWALVGNHHARQLFWVPIFQRAYWCEFWKMVKWYGFANVRLGRFVGENPLARLSLFFGFLLPLLFMITTGFALYAEGAQHKWLDVLFGWVVPLFGQPQDVHTWHHLGLWGFVVFTMLHIYAAIRQDVMGRSSIVSTMISGYRTFKD